MRHGSTILVSALLFAIATTGCGTLPRRPAVPRELESAAQVPGMPDVRGWGDTAEPRFISSFMLSLDRERDAQGVASIADLDRASFLALSGGGADGAYGAGILCGWSERGDRPAFKVVTGISTGALSAPFAFLGPEYDHVLHEVYTTLTMDQVSISRDIVSMFTADALTDTAPLRALIAKHVDQALLDRVAAEWLKGRILAIGTTNMDAQRPVMWSMGAIAASQDPRALQLFRDVMLASASIPGVFPPVMIRVEAEGKVFEEMHADGGVTSQVFLYPASFSFRDLPDAAGTRQRSVYIIRNGKLAPQPEMVTRRTLSVAQRAVSTLIKMQGIGDIYRLYLGAQRDGLDYNLAFIPSTFAVPSRSEFDTDYMKALFTLGRDMAKRGYPWEKAPPGFMPPEQLARP